MESSNEIGQQSEKTFQSINDSTSLPIPPDWLEEEAKKLAQNLSDRDTVINSFLTRLNEKGDLQNENMIREQMKVQFFNVRIPVRRETWLTTIANAVRNLLGVIPLILFASALSSHSANNVAWDGSHYRAPVNLFFWMIIAGLFIASAICFMVFTDHRRLHLERASELAQYEAQLALFFFRSWAYSKNLQK